MTKLAIADVDGTIELEFEDLKKFHGTRSICGLTVGFTVLHAAWQVLSPDKPVKRECVDIQSAFPGPGARDAFEMVTRAVSREKYTIATDVTPGPMIAEAAKGAYWFKVTMDGGSVELGLKPDVVPRDFLKLRRLLLSDDASDEEAKTFRSIQHGFSKSLLGMEPLDAVNVLSKDSVQ